MISELDMLALGVVFTRIDGRMKVEGPKVSKESAESIRNAIAERLECALVRRTGGPPMDGGHRWGVCDTCGQPMQSHKSGMCYLCDCAMQKLRDTGKI